MSNRVARKGLVEEHVFGGMNSDSSDRDIKPVEIRYAKNMVNLFSDASDSLRRENVPGNLKIDNSLLPSGTNICVGSAPVEEANSIFYFVYNSEGNHSIFQHKTTTRTNELVLQWSGFNFDPNLPIIIDPSRAGMVRKRFAKGDELNAIEKQDYPNGYLKQYIYLVFAQKGSGIRYIDVERAKLGGYGELNEEKISYYRPGPIIPPQVERVNDVTRTSNYRDHESFQFAYRYKFKDNSYSLFSTYSKLQPADMIPVRYGSTLMEVYGQTHNAFDIDVHIPSWILSEIKQVEFAFRKGNNAFFNTFETVTITDSVLTYVNGLSNTLLNDTYKVTQRFYNDTSVTAISPEEISKLIENIPRETNAIGIAADRVFHNKAKVDRNVDTSTCTWNVQFNESTRFTDLVNTILGTRRCKENGKYVVSVVFYDSLGRPTPALHKRAIQMPEVLSENSTTISNTSYIPQVRASGIAPEGAVYVGLLRTKELSYRTYMDFPVSVLYYVAEFTDGVSLNGWEFKFQEKVFLKEHPGPSNPTYRFTYLYLHIPDNLAFVPDTNCIVRFMTDDVTSPLYKKTTPILGVEDNFLVISDMNIVDFEDMPTGKAFIEVYKRNTDDDSIFYEVGEFFLVNNDGTYDTGNVNIPGDTYVLTLLAGERGAFKYQYRDTGIFSSGVSYPILHASANDAVNPIASTIESPTPCFSDGVGTTDIYDQLADERAQALNEAIEKTQESKQNAQNTGQVVGGAITVAGAYLATTGVGALVGAVVAVVGVIVTGISGLFGKKYNPPFIPRFLESRDGFVLSYPKESSDIGRPNIEIPDFKEKDRSTVIGFSGPFILDTEVNLVTTSEALDEYPLPTERTPITKLVKVDDVLIVLHESAATSVYLGKTFIQTQDADSFLVKTDGLIGGERQLASGRFGCRNPESVQVFSGRAYWWDQDNAEVCQYGNDGINALATIKKYKKYFRAQSDARSKYPDFSKVIGTYHVGYNMYILSFNQVDYFQVIEDLPEYKGELQDTYEFLSSLEVGDIVKVDGEYQRWNGVDAPPTSGIGAMVIGGPDNPFVIS